MSLPNRDPRATRLDDRLFRLLDEQLPAADLLRIELHRSPRLSGDEGATLELLIDHLPDGSTVRRAPGHVATARIGGSGPSVAIRAEMDGLPITEHTGVEWASTNGAMHACGHDVHMAAFIAVAHTIAAAADDAPRPLVGLFQPREETFPSGALDFLGGELLDVENVAAIIGAHVQPAMDSLSIASNSGTVNASSDEFVVTMIGDAAHGAYPHLSRDPVLAASNFVVSCQQIVARNLDPMHSAVLTVGEIRGGGAPNAIPRSTVVSGTVRAGSAEQRQFVHQRIREVADGIAAAHGCEAIVEIVVGDPPLINDARLAAISAQLLSHQGLDATAEFRSFGADDFAHYASAAPALMIFVGTVGRHGEGLHSNSYLPDRDAVRRVAYSMLAGYLAGSRIIEENLDAGGLTVLHPGEPGLTAHAGLDRSPRQ
ncbi:M20 metallopeptidase family protein [Compostimonas suwonensis]|uniref:Amidohydrolase n=1 Tax=Compostimonas suwonensis TaxID=1048394 RepID=A0A2M9BUR9_9MICO|nr:amidohydrolase [Compostimonas suwonensis]PJJ61698.1 amidohydrolase [Compostimonas suwonensis]